MTPGSNHHRQFADLVNRKYLEWQLRQGCRRSLKDFAASLGVSLSFVCAWANGRRLPGQNTAHHLAERWGHEVYAALGRDARLAVGDAAEHLGVDQRLLRRVISRNKLLLGLRRYSRLSIARSQLELVQRLFEESDWPKQGRRFGNRAAILRLIEQHGRLLTERQQYILRLRFVERQTLREVGRRMGVTRERVRQLENRALWLLSQAAEQESESP